MGFDTTIKWTSTGAKCRQGYFDHAYPPVEPAEAPLFVNQLLAVLRGWAFTTMSAYQPMDSVAASGAVNYTYNGTARSRNVDWQVFPQNWVQYQQVVLYLNYLADSNWWPPLSQPATPTKGARPPWQP